MVLHGVAAVVFECENHRVAAALGKCLLVHSLDGIAEEDLACHCAAVGYNGPWPKKKREGARKGECTHMSLTPRSLHTQSHSCVNTIRSIVAVKLNDAHPEAQGALDGAHIRLAGELVANKVRVVGPVCARGV